MNSDCEENLICLPSLRRNSEDWPTLLRSLAHLYLKGVKVNWKEFDKPYNRKRVCLPHYPFIRKRYWPESKTDLGQLIHPLLGSPMENPSCTKMFQSSLSLASIEYVRDHVVGDKIVFPGSGFLEMTLAAGLASINSNNINLNQFKKPIVVNNLHIEAPLLMQETITHNMLTTVDFSGAEENQKDIPIKILRKNKEASSTKWITHASASFTQFKSNEANQFLLDVDMRPTRESIGDRKFLEDTYNKLPNFAVNLGPNFKTLEESWFLEHQGKTIFKLHSNTTKYETGSNSYIIHPVILDAMLQAIMFSSFGPKWATEPTSNRKMYLPINIGKFTWLPMRWQLTHNTSECFIHVVDDKVSGPTAILTNSAGQVRCAMSSVEIIETTPKAFKLAMRKQIANTTPDLWEQTWKNIMGASQLRVDLDQLTLNCDSKVLQELQQFKTTARFKETENYLQKYSYLKMVNVLRECGWLPEVGMTFQVDSLMEQLRINEEYKSYFRFMFKALNDEGIVANVGITEDKWSVKRQPPSLNEIKEQLVSLELLLTQFPNIKNMVDLAREIANKLPNFLQAKESPLPTYFPDDENAPSASKYYVDLCNVTKFNELNLNFLMEALNKLQNADGEFVLRILEVGGGTGCLTAVLLKVLSDYNIPFEYTFTDVSPAFFSAAQKRFQQYEEQLIFKKLDIEQDPLSQGFSPSYYDLIYSFEVVHTTKFVSNSLRNLNILLKPSGYLNMVETVKPCKHVTFVWGLLPGYWAFQDFGLRPDHCSLEPEKWRNVLSSTGFHVKFEFSYDDKHHMYFYCQKVDEISPITNTRLEKSWLVMKSQNTPISSYIIYNLKRFGRKVHIMEVGGNLLDKMDLTSIFENWMNYELEGILYVLPLDQSKRSQEEILQPLLNLVKFIPDYFTVKQATLPRIVVLTQESELVDDRDRMTGFASGTISAFCNAVRNETPDLLIRTIDIDQGIMGGLDMEQIFHEMFLVSKEETVAFRGSSKFVPKIQPLKSVTSEEESLEIPWKRFQLILPDSKLIHDLEFTHLEEYILEEEEVEIEIKVTGLNFRDIFAVMKPTEKFSKLNDVGLDFSGKVKRVGGRVSKWKSGDFVYGFNMSGGALPSHVKMHQDLLLKVPGDSNLWDVATLPAVSLTAYVCLVEEAKVKDGDTVLIHTGTGGVGLVAIDICKSIGANVIATAGNEVKRRYLKEVVGIEHVFHSRDTSYMEGIMKATNERGVDVVLNTLTGKGFKEATLSACAKGARFIEISKLNVWTSEEVQQLRPDVLYVIVDIIQANEETNRQRLQRVQQNVEKKVIRPLPYTNFDAMNVRQALNHLQKAKHIGKVLVTMPQFKYERGEMKVESLMFCERSTYLITGGLGGIGFAVCKWMLSKGAKNIILAGRSAPSPEMKKELEAMNRTTPANLVAVQLDIGNFVACKELIDTKLQVLGLPPLKGIMHAAGITANDLYVNQSWEKFSSTLTSKVDGTLNLHEITKSMNLDFFVLFSSICSVIGSPGQSNYASSNAFQDKFAQYRRSIGMKATCINFGPWGEVGMATEADYKGLRPYTTKEGILVLENAMKTHRTQTIAFYMESFHEFAAYAPIITTLIDKKTMEKLSNAPGIESKRMAKPPEQFWTEYNAAANKEDKADLIQMQVKSLIRTVLNLGGNEEMEKDLDLRNLGVDSLMFTEIKNGVQSMLGNQVKISLRELKECRTVTSICGAVQTAVEGQGHE